MIDNFVLSWLLKKSVSIFHRTHTLGVERRRVDIGRDDRNTFRNLGCIFQPFRLYDFVLVGYFLRPDTLSNFPRSGGGGISFVFVILPGSNHAAKGSLRY